MFTDVGGRYARSSRTPVRLAGGNPQIAKADGDDAVQDYLQAMPDWKHTVGRTLDTLIERVVPNVRKAIRWNSPFYGVDGQGWFLSLHCFATYIKAGFLNGGSLQPQPPVASKHASVRYVHIHSLDELDTEQWTTWLTQASTIPGQRLF